MCSVVGVKNVVRKWGGNNLWNKVFVNVCKKHIAISILRIMRFCWDNCLSCNCEKVALKDTSVFSVNIPRTALIKCDNSRCQQCSLETKRPFVQFEQQFFPAHVGQSVLLNTHWLLRKVRDNEHRSKGNKGGQSWSDVARKGRDKTISTCDFKLPLAEISAARFA